MAAMMSTFWLIPEMLENTLSSMFRDMLDSVSWTDTVFVFISVNTFAAF